MDAMQWLASGAMALFAIGGLVYIAYEMFFKDDRRG